MKRICSYCGKSIGEKCGRCGKNNPLRTLAGSPGRFKCPRCGHCWDEGTDKATHTICDECLLLQQQPKPTIADPMLCGAIDNLGRPHRMHGGRCLYCWVLAVSGNLGAE